MKGFGKLNYHHKNNKQNLNNSNSRVNTCSPISENKISDNSKAIGIEKDKYEKYEGLVIIITI